MGKNNSKIPTFLSQRKRTAEKSHSHPPDPAEEKPQNPSNTSSRGERCQELFFPPGVRREVLLLCPFFLTAPSRSVISTEQQQPFHLRQGHAGERGEEKKKKGGRLKSAFFGGCICATEFLCAQGPGREGCGGAPAVPGVHGWWLCQLCVPSPCFFSVVGAPGSLSGAVPSAHVALARCCWFVTGVGGREKS